MGFSWVALGGMNAETPAHPRDCAIAPTGKP
jgi:hypothetical protein